MHERLPEHGAPHSAARYQCIQKAAIASTLPARCGCQPAGPAHLRCHHAEHRPRHGVHVAQLGQEEGRSQEANLRAQRAKQSVTWAQRGSWAKQSQLG